MTSRIDVAYHRMNSDGNLTRCYRTIFTIIGATTIHLIDSKCQLRAKHLHSAKDSHTIERYSSEDEFWELQGDKEHIIIEINSSAQPIQGIKEYLKRMVWDRNPRKIIIHFGGENEHLPMQKAPWNKYHRFKIETKNRLPFINDVVTGIVLHEIKR